MLDAEVEFKLVREIPKSRVINKLEKIADISCVIAGGIGGFYGIKYGLSWGNFWSFAIGGLGGAGIGAGVGDYFEKVIENMYHNHAVKKPIIDDEKAKENGAEVATFRYRGNPVECVLRDDYKDSGNIFHMRANDGIIHSTKFSYQPQNNNLEFSFGVPLFEEDKDWHKTRSRPPQDQFLESMDNILITMIGNLQEQLTGEKNQSVKKKTPRKEYVEKLDWLISEEKKAGQNIKHEFSMNQQSLYLTISYTGGDVCGPGLSRMSRLTNKLLNSAYQIRRKYNL